MQIGGGPPPHAMRPPDRTVAAPVEAEAVAAAAVAAAGSPGPTVDGAARGPGSAHWERVLEVGNGNKVGIRRRMEAAIMAERNQADLGIGAPADAPREVPSVEDLPPAETPTGEEPVGGDAPPAAAPVEAAGDGETIIAPPPAVIIDGTVDNGLLEMIESLQSDLPEPLAAPIAAPIEREE